MPCGPSFFSIFTSDVKYRPSRGGVNVSLLIVSEDLLTSSTLVILTTKYSSNSARLSFAMLRGIAPTLAPFLTSIEVELTRTSVPTTASLSSDDSECRLPFKIVK